MTFTAAPPRIPHDMGIAVASYRAPTGTAALSVACLFAFLLSVADCSPNGVADSSVNPDADGPASAS